jgi:hypothetical protein
LETDDDLSFSNNLVSPTHCRFERSTIDPLDDGSGAQPFARITYLNLQISDRNQAQF